MTHPEKHKQRVAEITLRAHDACMSDDPLIASKGRIIKLILPALEQWQDGEISRSGSAPRSVIMSFGWDLVETVLKDTQVTPERDDAIDVMIAKLKSYRGDSAAAQRK